MPSPTERRIPMKLTDTQLMLLSAASQREDHGIELGPNLKGGAAQRDRLCLRPPWPAMAPRMARRWRAHRQPDAAGAGGAAPAQGVVPHARSIAGAQSRDRVRALYHAARPVLAQGRHGVL